MSNNHLSGAGAVQFQTGGTEVGNMPKAKAGGVWKSTIDIHS